MKSYSEDQMRRAYQEGKDEVKGRSIYGSFARFLADQTSVTVAQLAEMAPMLTGGETKEEEGGVEALVKEFDYTLSGLDDDIEWALSEVREHTENVVRKTAARLGLK